MNRSTLIAVAIFGLLLAGVVITIRESPERGISRISFAAVDPEAITRVVATGRRAVELEKSGDRWQVKDGKRADAAAVKQLLEAIPKVASADVVTRNKGRFAELEVDAENGTLVRAFAGEEEVAGFTIGKATRGGSHVLAGDTVYAVQGVSPSVFVRPESDWLEKRLFDVKAEDVTKVDFRPREGTAYALVERDGQWVLEDPSVLPDRFRFDQNAARALVNAAINVRAKDVLGEDPGLETTGLDDGADTLSLTEAAGATLSLRMGGGAGEDKAVYARADGRAEIVTLHENTARQLRKAVTDLRDLTLMDFDTGEVTRLELRDGTQRLVFTKSDGTWSLESATGGVRGGFKLDEAKVRGRVGALKASRGLALAEDPKRAGLGTPSASATAVLSDGRSVTLAFGSETTHDQREALFARGNADGHVYVVAKSTRDALLRGLESFQQDDQPSGLADIDPASMSNLPPEVRQALERKIEEEKKRQEFRDSIEAGSRNAP